MSISLLPPTDGRTTKINFDTRAEYKIRKTTYLVTSRYAESGEDLRTKITRVLKQGLDEKTVVEFDAVR